MNIFQSLGIGLILYAFLILGIVIRSAQILREWSSAHIALGIILGIMPFLLGVFLLMRKTNN